MGCFVRTILFYIIAAIIAANVSVIKNLLFNTGAIGPLCFLLIPPIIVFFQLVRWAERRKNTFLKNLPEGYAYPYFFNVFVNPAIGIILTKTMESGYALNIKEGKIFILSRGKSYIFPMEKIRQYRWNWTTPGKVRAYGEGLAGFMAATDAVGENNRMKIEAFNESGIFLEIEDIDNPVMQIKFTNRAGIDRSFEILQQFFNRTLIDFDEYLKKQTSKEWLKFKKLWYKRSEL